MFKIADEYYIQGVTLKEIIDDHMTFLASNGRRGNLADLSSAYISGVILPKYTNLSKANFNGATLNNVIANCCKFDNCSFRNANMLRCNFDDSSFSTSDLSYTKFEATSLCYTTILNATIINSNFYQCNLFAASFNNSNLEGTKFKICNLLRSHFCSVKNMPNLPMACPTEGSFIGWKKVEHGYYKYLIKLQIPASAKRSSAMSNKCRCSKAKVLGIYDLKGNKLRISSVTNFAYCNETVYEVGKMVYPDSFDEDRMNECSNGIHFFINKQEAIDYAWN